MASVFAHLLSTLPFESAVAYGMTKLAVTWAEEEKNRPAISAVKGTRGVMTPTASMLPAVDHSIRFEVFDTVRPLDATSALSVPVPAAPSGKTEGEIELNIPHQKLWSFKHDGTKPNVITDVRCRVREATYKNYQVLDSVTFGYEKDGKLQSYVVAETESGTKLELPLTSEFVYGRYLVSAGYLNHDKSTKSFRYPLKMSLDRGLVVAFAFELDEKNAVVPYRPPTTDKGHAAYKEWIDRWNKKPLRDEKGNRWLDRALQGDFMALPLESEPLLPQLRAGVDELKTVKVAPPRILVTISFATCKERADFEPIGVVGMARMYPHLSVRASFKLRAVHGSIRVKRPAKTTVLLDKGDTTGDPKCCGAGTDIGSILVSDANYGDAWFDKTLPIGPDLYFLPFWGGLFAYYLIDAHKAADEKKKPLKGQTMRVVDRDKGERAVKNCGHRTLAGSPQKLEVIYKVPRQGQWDNVHLAPRLVQSAPQVFVQTRNASEFGAASVIMDVDPERMRTTDIVMAPFCSHDCFHMHWRWSTVADTTQSKGFSGTTPFQKGGAPLIADSHDLDYTPWGPNEFTLTEHAAPTKSSVDDATKTIPSYELVTFFYFGGAYAQGLSSYIEVAKVKVRSAIEKEGVKFVGADGKGLSFLEDAPTTYWNLRYWGRIGKNAKAEAVEWIQMSAADVHKARRE